jgi:ATP-dependent DNA helicase PIF1
MYTDSEIYIIGKSLKLRHIKLEQIHRQKDTRFQDILNKIRNGISLSEEEWHDLEKDKPEPPKNAFAVRLMSRVNDVKRFNEKELAALPKEYTSRTWRAVDTVDKLVLQRDGVEYPPDIGKIKEYRESLRDHKLPLELTLKRGARVVLLHNLDHDRGLVNGSQGVVMGFAKAPLEVPFDADELTGPHKEIRYRAMKDFQSSNQEETRPMVHFANGERVLITSVAQAGIRGPLSLTEQYVATRTQLPLALAWALSIHKSQGMTLDFVHASSQHIFESGQLYVALSRATHLDGLTLTGFNRTQLKMDPDVLQFYTETKWEKLERPPKRAGLRGKKD